MRNSGWSGSASLPLLDEAVDRRAAGRRRSTASGMPFSWAACDHLGVVRIEDDLALRLHQLGVAPGRRRDQPVGVVEQHAQVADAPDAGVEAGRRLAGLEPGVAEDALLRLAGGPVEVDLLVRAGADAHAPAAAAVLVDEDDAVLAPLVDGPRAAGGHAGRVEAVVADAWQVEEDHPLDPLELGPLLRGEPLQVGIVARRRWGSRQRSSSQFGPDLISMGLPSMSEMERAIGWSLPAGASNRSSYR